MLAVRAGELAEGWRVPCKEGLPQCWLEDLMADRADIGHAPEVVKRQKDRRGDKEHPPKGKRPPYSRKDPQKDRAQLQKIKGDPEGEQGHVQAPQMPLALECVGNIPKAIDREVGDVVQLAADTVHGIQHLSALFHFPEDIGLTCIKQRRDRTARILFRKKRLNAADGNTGIAQEADDPHLRKIILGIQPPPTLGQGTRA